MESVEKDPSNANYVQAGAISEKMQIMSSHGPSHPASIADQRQLARYGDFPLFSPNFLNWFHGKVVFCYNFSVYSVILYVCLGMGIFCLGMGILYVRGN
jgi:hypothetical protein